MKTLLTCLAGQRLGGDMRTPIALVALATTLSSTAQASVIANSNPRTTTHQINYANFTLGINSNGGGVINKFILAGGSDLMKAEADLYGRSGQTAIRDKLHTGKYNPTQAGFNEYLGTPSNINVSNGGDTLTVQVRRCSLWHGDSQYDFTRWENIGADPYNNDGGNSDSDAKPNEENLAGKQNTEVESEFDYWGIYERIHQNNLTYNLPVIRHRFEFRYIRNPGHCFSQFGPGSSVLNTSNGNVTDVSNNNPSGNHPDLTYYMANMTAIWSIRFDDTNSSPSPFTHTHWVNGSGNWQTANRNGNDFANTFYVHNNNSLRNRLSSSWGPTPGSLSKRLIIAAQESNVNGTKRAFGVYVPASGTNNTCIIGRNRSTGAVLYTDDRTYAIRLFDEQRTSKLEKIGVQFSILGVIHPVTLSSLNAYESFRGDVYMLVGQPNQIRTMCVNDLWGL